MDQNFEFKVYCRTYSMNFGCHIQRLGAIGLPIILRYIFLIFPSKIIHAKKSE